LTEEKTKGLTKEEYLERRKTLLDELKKLKEKIVNDRYDLKATEEAMELAKKEVGDLNIQEIRRKMRRLEFKIQTEAISLKHERALMKEIEKIKNDFRRTERVARLDRRMKRLKEEINKANDRIEKIKLELDELKRIREETRNKEKIERSKEKIIAPTVSLGEIVEIKRKK